MFVVMKKMYRKFQYADLKGVSREYISKLIKANKLKTETVLDMEVIIDCPSNDELFENPAHNRRKKKK